jgi:murein L,D-transpeptidase YafK
MKAFERYQGRYVLYVSKKNFSLHVYNRKIELVAGYKISYGLNPDAGSKLHEGDNRTPEGSYRITEILSMDADKKTEAYKKLDMMNRLYFRAADGHYRYGNKGADIGDNAYGPRFFLINYPNENDRSRYDEALKKNLIPKKNGKSRGPGYGIAIHGNNDPSSVGHPASSGCIRMYNDDIVELEGFIQIGTPVIISGE